MKIYLNILGINVSHSFLTANYLTLIKNKYYSKYLSLIYQSHENI
jgi:hypothetical protein